MPSIKYKKKTYAGATFPVLEMTKAEYDALPEAKKMDGTVYMITDDTGGWEAENASYDNTSSGLTATNVQSALDEIVSDVSEISSNINSIKSQLENVTNDLNALINTQHAKPSLCAYWYGATGQPGPNSGIVLTWGDGNYRQQTAFDLGGSIYTRVYSQGTLSNWTKQSVN